MIRRRSAFSEFERLHEQMDQMWRRLSGGPSGRSRFCSPMLAPPTDVYETAKEVVIVAEIAGIERQEVDIEVEGDRLTFHGEKVDRDAEPGHRHTQMEICYGAFGRTVVLPARVDASSAEVSYSEGFLRIVLPKLREEGPRRVRVNVRKHNA
jgi:HSP20 family protein